MPFVHHTGAAARGGGGVSSPSGRSRVASRTRSPFAPTPPWMFVSYLILGLWSLVVLFPLFWLVVTSFKLPIDVFNGPNYLPGVDFDPSLHAWQYIFVDLGSDTLRPYVNTVVVALTSSVLALVFGSMAGYALVRIDYRPRLGSVGLFIACVALAIVAVVRFGVRWEFALVVGGVVFVLLVQTLGRRFKRSLKNNDIAFWMISQRILPPVAVVIPIYVLYQRFGLLDSYAALIITYFAVNLPIVVWLMRDFFRSLPVELEEMAMIDGASRYRIFLTIVLPIAKPGLARHLLVGADPDVERVFAGAVSVDRQHPDAPLADCRSKRHPWPAVVVHVGVDLDHGHPSPGHRFRAGALHHPRPPGRRHQGMRLG